MSNSTVLAVEDLPLFEDLESPDFGQDIESAVDDLFSRSYQGPLRTPKGVVIVYGNQEVRAMTRAKDATHQTIESSLLRWEAKLGAYPEELHRYISANSFWMRQPQHRPNKQFAARHLSSAQIDPLAAVARAAVAAQIERLPPGDERHV